jgi:hypothetical protein
MRPPRCLCICDSPPINFRIPEPVLWNLVCTSWHLSPSHWRTSHIPQSVFVVSMCIPSLLGDGSITRSRGKEYTQEWKNCWSRRFLYGTCGVNGESVGLCTPPIVTSQRLFKYVLASTKTSWRSRFLCGPCRSKWKYAISCSQNFLLLSRILSVR